MESRQAGILRLCIIMGFFSVSIFFLNSNKKIIMATHIDVLNCKAEPMITTLSLDQAYETMSSLFVAHDVDLIVKVMSQFKYRLVYDLAERMINDQKIALSPEEKINVLCGVVAHCSCKKNIQYDLLDLLLKYPRLYAQTPALLILARSKYTDLIALFITWGKERQKNKKAPSDFLALSAERAFVTAVHEDDYQAVEQLFSKKVRLSQDKASFLLWYVVEHGKNSALVSLLLRHAQADVNYTRCGKTLLIAAVEKNNIDSIRILLDAGAVVDRVSKSGTALHVAMKHQYHSAEQLLREYGAA
jgi:Ankyrin repeats (3 copies)